MYHSRTDPKSRRDCATARARPQAHIPFHNVTLGHASYERGRPVTGRQPPSREAGTRPSAVGSCAGPSTRHRRIPTPHHAGIVVVHDMRGTQAASSAERNDSVPDAVQAAPRVASHQHQPSLRRHRTPSPGLSRVR
jgi:hypothetical protein